MWHQPHPSFAAHVRRIAGFVGRTSGSQCRTELPSAGVTLILGLGDRIRVSSTTGSGVFTSFLAGLHEIPVDTEHDGTLSCLQIDLTPLGAYRLLGMPMSDLTDTVVGVELLRQPGWRDLGEQLADASTWTDRFRLAERTLGGWWEEGPTEDPEVAWAWRALSRSHGAVPVSRLAAEVGWSRRHFANRFKHQVGLTPKSTGQLLRFSRALSLLTGPGLLMPGATPPEPVSISEVAAETGYADHSHLVREFRRLTGLPPSTLLSQAAG